MPLPWQIPGLNITKILLLVLLQQILGLIWYSPWLFAYKWLRLSGLSPNNLHYWPFVISAITSFALVCGLAWMLYKLAISRIINGLCLVFFCWLIFLVGATATHAAFMQSTFGLLVINLAYDLLCYLLSGALLVYWIRDAANSPKINQ